ncbi:MAG: hypothetical protein ACJA1U_003061, partial [Bermanella sp.]
MRSGFWNTSTSKNQTLVYTKKRNVYIGIKGTPMKRSFRSLPLKNKLLGAIIAAFVVLVVILNTNLSMNLDQMKEELVGQTR